MTPHAQLVAAAKEMRAWLAPGFGELISDTRARILREAHDAIIACEATGAGDASNSVTLAKIAELLPIDEAFSDEVSAMLNKIQAGRKSTPIKAGDAGAGWIAIEDRLPEVADGDSVAVIICRTGEDGKPYTFGAWYGKNLDISEWAGDENVITAGFLDLTYEHPSVDEYWSPIDGVTHWMPLPKAPPAVEQKKKA